MAKNKSKKNITIDQLAQMVQKGFTEQTEKFTELLETKFNKVEKDLTIIKGQL
jgi:hypothetical protein